MTDKPPTAAEIVKMTRKQVSNLLASRYTASPKTHSQLTDTCINFARNVDEGLSPKESFACFVSEENPSGHRINFFGLVVDFFGLADPIHPMAKVLTPYQVIGMDSWDLYIFLTERLKMKAAQVAMGPIRQVAVKLAANPEGCDLEQIVTDIMKDRKSPSCTPAMARGIVGLFEGSVDVSPQARPASKPKVKAKQELKPAPPPAEPEPERVEREKVHPRAIVTDCLRSGVEPWMQEVTSILMELEGSPLSKDDVVAAVEIAVEQGHIPTGITASSAVKSFMARTGLSGTEEYEADLLASGYAENTAALYSSCLRKFLKWVADTGKKDLPSFIAEASTHMHPRTINIYDRAIRLWMSMATGSIARPNKKPKNVKRDETLAITVDFDRIVQAAAAIHPAGSLVAGLIAYAGASADEISNLRVRDIHDGAEWIIDLGSGERSRSSIVINPGLWKRLETILKHNSPSSLVVPDTGGKPITSSKIKRIIASASTSVGLTKFRIESLRCSYAARLLEGKLEVDEVAALCCMSRESVVAAGEQFGPLMRK